MNEFDTVGLVERAKAITLRPDETWPRIAAEQSSPGDIITRYAMPLMAIGPVASFVGGQLFGIGMIFATFRRGLIHGLTMAVTSFVMGIISLIVVALVADTLAPKFEGESNRTQSFKLVAYSMTPGWIAGVLGILPALGLLVLIASLYGIYLFYKGATPLLKIPAAKAGGFTVVTVVCVFLVNLVLGMLLATVTGAVGLGASAIGAMAGDEDSVEVNVPGVGKIESGKMEEAAKSLEALASGQPAKPVDMAALQGLLPAAVGSYQRTAIESAGASGIGSKAEATYRNGDKEVRVEIVDVAGLGAVAGALGGLGIEENREDANGYERTRTVDGALQTEKWNNKTSHGSFARQVAGRFMVSASGDVASIDELKAIVAGIDQGKLARLAK